jgi:hypothetical protein
MNETQCLLHYLNVQMLALCSRRKNGPWGEGEQWKWVQIRQKLREASELAGECLARASEDLVDEWVNEREEHSASRPLRSFLAMWVVAFHLARPEL